MVEYYSTIKKNEVMPFAATWMGLEIVILSKVSLDRGREIDTLIAKIISLVDSPSFHHSIFSFFRSK